MTTRRGALTGIAAALVSAGCTDRSPSTGDTIRNTAPREGEKAASGGTATSVSEPVTSSPHPKPATVAPIPKAFGITDIVKVPYGDHEAQFVNVRMPDIDRDGVAAPGLPVVVLIHGGYWITTDGTLFFDELAVDVTARGAVTINVEYRAISQGGGWPGTYEDIRAAIELLAQPQFSGPDAQFGQLDLSRVGVLGHSAGAPLALWSASKPKTVKPRAALALAGLLDFRTSATPPLETNGRAVIDFLKTTPEKDSDRYAKTSPVELVPLGIPTRAVHGTADATVSHFHSERFVDAAVAAGDLSELVLLEGGGHGAATDLKGASWEQSISWLLTSMTR